MKTTSLFSFTAAACLLASNAMAGGAADKVTGDFTLSNGSYRLLSAHESGDGRPQKGFLFSWSDDGLWFEQDFSDTENTCVNVFGDGQARIGGLVSEGNGPQVGRYFGYLLVDAGEGASLVDHGFTYRVSTDYWSEEARLALLEWCASGTLAELPNQAIWMYVISDGNLQVHNHPGDGD